MTESLTTISEWLTKQNYPEYIPNFSEFEITYDSLPYVSESVLKDIGVKKIGDRIKLNNEITKLKMKAQNEDLRKMIKVEELFKSFNVNLVKPSPPPPSSSHAIGVVDDLPASKKSLVSFILESGSVVKVNVSGCFNSSSIKKKLLKQLFPTTATSPSLFDIYITDSQGNLQLLFDVELVTICHSVERIEKTRLLLSDKHSTPSETAINTSLQLIKLEPSNGPSPLLRQKSNGANKREEFRSVFGQRPSSQLISTNLSQYFPNTGQSRLQRTIRNSVRYSIMSSSNPRPKSSVGDYLLHCNEETLDSLNLKASMDAEKSRFSISSLSSIDNSNRVSKIDLMSIPTDSSDSEDETRSMLFPKENQFQNWLKGARIGSGSFGTVYLGMDAHTGELMAVKQVDLIPWSGSGSGEDGGGENKQQPVTGDLKKIHEKVIEALETEMKLLSELKHPNIVTYLGSSSTDTHLNIFLEYIPGGSLSSMLKTYGPFEEPLIRNFTRQILIGLNYLHSKKIIHRDIKGANILIDINGQVKISDFGISKKLAPTSAQSQTTKRTSLQGSVYWMSPEVVKQQTPTPKSDIWSLGCLIIEMFTGTHAYPNFSQMQAIFKIGTNVKPEIPNWCTVDSRLFLEKCLEVDVSKRCTGVELLKDRFLEETLLVG